MCLKSKLQTDGILNIHCTPTLVSQARLTQCKKEKSGLACETTPTHDTKNINTLTIPLVEGQMTEKKVHGSSWQVENQISRAKHPLQLCKRFAYMIYTVLHTCIYAHTINIDRTIDLYDS